MEQYPNIPDNLKQYDTPENRQAYQSMRRTRASMQPELDHTGVPEDLWKFDTAESRKEYRSYRLNEQMKNGLVTSDGRFLRLTPSQVNWVTNKYRETWTYGHDVADQDAFANGYLPPSMYDKYNKKSSYDIWAAQVGMPNEKDLEKYLAEYDQAVVEAQKRSGYYSSTPEELRRRMETGLVTSDNRVLRLTPEQADWIQKQYAKTWEYGHDVADQEAAAAGQLPPSLLSKYNEDSAFDVWATQAGMPNEKDIEKWLKDYDAAVEQYNAEETQYNADVARHDRETQLLDDFYNDVADRLYRAEFQGVKRGSEEWQQIFFSALSEPKYADLQQRYKRPTEEQKKSTKKKATEASEEPLSPEAAFLQQLDTPKAEHEEGSSWGRTQQGLAAMTEAARSVAEKGYYFPAVPELSFDINQFASMYDRNVTQSEADGGYGRINRAVRDAAGKIRYDGNFWSDAKSSVFGRTTTPDIKRANLSDTAAVCKDLLRNGYSTDEFWTVIGGLTAGGIESKSVYGPGLVFDEATQEQIAAYGNVASTRFARPLFLLMLENPTAEQVAQFVERQSQWSGATQESLTKAYEICMTALGGTEEGDRSRDWDGLSYSERRDRDAAFKKMFDAAILSAPSLPVESGYADVTDPSEVQRLSELRKNYNLKKKAESRLNTGSIAFTGKGGSLDDWWEYRWDTIVNGADPWDRLARSKGFLDEGTKQGYEQNAGQRMDWSVSDRNKEAFYEEAKAHGYSAYEVDEVLRQLGAITAGSPYGVNFWEENPDFSQEEHYREHLLQIYRENPDAVQYINSMSETDLRDALVADKSVSGKDASWIDWVAAPVNMISRGAVSYAAGFINFADMLAHGFDEDSRGSDAWRSAEVMNRLSTRMSLADKHDNQSKFLSTVVDAGSELVRMYLTAKTGGLFAKGVGGVMSLFGKGGAAAVTWIGSGGKLANLVKWGIESVPFITSAMGSSYAEARSEGATNREAAAYGLLAGAVEGLTEKVSVELLIGEGGSKVINKVTGGLMKSGVSKILSGKTGVAIVNLLKAGLNAGVEAQQEGLSYGLDLLLKKAIYKPDAKWSWSEFGEQAGMGALCGAMGLAFQNYGASYVNQMLDFALSSSENMKTFTDFAMKVYGASLNTEDNYVVKPEDYDPAKILPATEWNEAWTSYLDACETLDSAQKKYEAAISSLDADDTEKARQVMYWRNQVASADPNDAASANTMARAMEQLTIAERAADDTRKKNQKLREEARTELNNAMKRSQNAMDETSAKIRAHSRAEIAATLGAVNAGLDSSYDIATTDAAATAERAERAEALQSQLEETQTYEAALVEAYNALEQLERASEAQREAKAKLYDAAVATLSAQYDSKPVIAGALDRINGLSEAQDALAESLEATADEMNTNLEQARKEDQIRTANFAADLDSIDSWYGAEIDQIDADMTEAERDVRDGRITKDEYEAKKEEAASRIQAAMETRDEIRQAAAENFAAEGGVAQGMEGLANAMRLEASEARAKASEIRNAVVRALALRTQEAAFAAIDAITTGEGLLTVDQREALSDEMNRIVAEQLMNDEATKAVYDAMEGLKLIEQQAGQKGAEASTQTASEAQEGAAESEQETTPATSEERQAELQKAVAVGKAFGVDVQIVDDLPKELNGKYFDDGRILISKNATNAPMQVLVHELAHYIEGTAAYDRLQQYVFSTLAQDPNFNLNVEIAAYRTLYAQSRDAMGESQLSDEDATKEAKAEIVSRWCEKNLFTDEASINRLCSQETSLAKRILHGIQNMLSGKRRDPALVQLQTAEKLYIKALNQARAFGGAKINRNSVTSLLVGAGLYVDSNSNGFKVYRTRYDERGDRISSEELKPNLESPCDGPITTDDIMNHSPIGAFIRLGQQFGNIEGFYDSELEPGTNLRAIPSDRLSVGAKIVNLFTDLSNMCLAYGDNGMVWDFVGGYVFSSITSNSDPQYSRTVDYGTICRKTQNLITAMSEAMVQKGRGLYADEIIELSNELVQQGKLDVPCSMCYVFNRWLGLGGYLNRVKVYQDRYAAMTPDEALKAFQDVQAQIDEVVDSRNFKTLINDLCAKHGIDPKAYLNELAASNKAFRETGKFQATKKEMSKSDARTRAIQLYSKLLDDCEQSHDRKSLKDVDTQALMKDLETRRGVTDAYGWFTKVLLNENEDGTFGLKRSVLSEDGKSWATGADGNASFVVPTEILFNLNASDRFASEYPDVWRFRTAGGSALGKATYGYTDARLGEFTYGAAVSNVKSQDVPKAPRWGVVGETSTAENQPKNKLSFVDSRGEFTTGGAATFAKAVQNVLNQAWLGGDRMQSSSDYTSKHALDYLITAFEMQCLGAPVQTYTKVPEALAFFNAIGASANGSLIAKGNGVKGTPVYEFNEASGHYRVVEGSASLEISKVQGINPDDVRALVDASDNLQFIMVGMNREHTALTISTPWITMCIPVHMSGGTVDNISARAVAQGDPGLTKADVNDATGCQNDKLMTEKELASTYKDNVDMVRLAREQRAAILSKSTSKSAKVDLNKIRMVDDWVSTKYPGNHRLLENMYNAFQKSGAQLKVEFNEDGTPKGLGFGIYPNEYWDTTSTIDNAYVNGDRFIEYCWMLGVKPRFSYGEYGKHGSFPGLPKFEGYWKVLIDRPMYNADGSYRTVRPVDVSRLTAAMFTGEAATASGAKLYNADESAKLSQQEATAARVGGEYAGKITGTAAEAMKAHSRNALAGDIDAKLAELRKQYGAMPTSNAETAPGREDVVLPRQTNDDTYVRRAAQTFMRSPTITDASASEIGKAVLRGEFDYQRQTNEETESRAAQRIIELGGQEAALQHLENVARGTARPNAETVAIGEQLILDAQAVGDANAFEKAVAYTALIGTAAGQTVQAFSMINKLSPQGIALYMSRVVDRLNRVEYKDLIAKGKMKPIELTEDQIGKLLTVKSFSDATRVQTEILTEIAQQIPLTMKEQLRNWRYMCMLGNVRTNVRNIAGNLAMAGMRIGKDTIAAGLEALDVRQGERLAQKAAEARRAGDTAKADRLQARSDRHLDRSDRTKALGVGENAEAMKANRAYAKGTLDDATKAMLKGDGKDVGLSVLRDQKRMFNNKVLNKVGKTVLAPLDIFDVKFLEPQYVHAYASWMTARGLTSEDMTLRRRNEAQKYAIQEAQRATFRDANWFATKLTEIRSRNLASELIVGGLMPFAKTPANVLRRGIEYSPAGLVQGMAQLYKAGHDTNLSRSERMQLRTQAIDRLSSGVTGTGLLALGVFLRAMGVLEGKDDDDDRAADFFRDMGRQNYSARFGSLSMTLDWLAPVNMPMFMGAAIWDAAEKLSEGEELAWKDIADPLLSIADPLIEMSMLQGIQSALKTYGSENVLSAVATNTLQSFAGQFYPTIGGQLARTIDYTRRQPDSKQYWLQSMAAKVPFLSKTIKPYVGGYGEEETFEGGWFARALEQFIAPGYFKLEKHDDLTEELARVYEQTGVNKFLPQRPSDYKTLNLGKLYGTYDLTPEEQVEYEKLFRGSAAQALADAIKTPEYRGLSDADKADFLSEVYTQATKAARAEMKQTIIERHEIGASAATEKP